MAPPTFSAAEPPKALRPAMTAATPADERAAQDQHPAARVPHGSVCRAFILGWPGLSRRRASPRGASSVPPSPATGPVAGRPQCSSSSSRSSAACNSDYSHPETTREASSIAPDARRRHRESSPARDRRGAGPLPVRDGGGLAGRRPRTSVPPPRRAACRWSERQRVRPPFPSSSAFISVTPPGRTLPASPAAMASIACASAGDSSISWIVALRSTPRAFWIT